MDRHADAPAERDRSNRGPHLDPQVCETRTDRSGTTLALANPL